MTRVLPWLVAGPLLALSACTPPAPDPALAPLPSARPLPPAATTAPASVPTADPAEVALPPLVVAPVPFASLGSTTCIARGEGHWRCWGANSYAALGTAVKTETCGTKLYPASCVRRPV